MAGTVTITYDEDFAKRIKTCKFDWLSSTGGAADATTKVISGQLLRATFKPDAGGTQPTDSYDATLKDAENFDVLAGLGANLDDTVVTSVVPVVTDGNVGNMAPIAINSPLTLAVTNAGNSKGGEIVLYYR